MNKVMSAALQSSLDALGSERRSASNVLIVKCAQQMRSRGDFIFRHRYLDDSQFGNETRYEINNVMNAQLLKFGLHTTGFSKSYESFDFNVHLYFIVSSRVITGVHLSEYAVDGLLSYDLLRRLSDCYRFIDGPLDCMSIVGELLLVRPQSNNAILRVARGYVSAKMR